MKRSIGTVLLILGVALFASACWTLIVQFEKIEAMPADQLPGYLVGVFLVPFVLVISGIVVRRKRIDLDSVVEANRNHSLVHVSPAAVKFAFEEFKQRGWCADAAIRIVESEAGQSFGTSYDFISDDDKDWIDDHSGVPILVERSLAKRVAGLTLDAANGEFVVTGFVKPA